MAWQPPRFRHPAATVRKPWSLNPDRADRRLRGRAGVRMRELVLREEPFCRLCLAAGQHVASDTVDHILALFLGGTNERNNQQALCQPCHDAKSKAERAEAREG
jgi:5-methylcytosine-specific restriction protein A